MLIGADGQHGAGEPGSECVQHTHALGVIQHGCRTQIEAQLHAGIRGVDLLATGPGGAGELLYQLTGRHQQAAGNPRARRHM